MTFLKWNIAAMLAGFLLDLIIGDPEGWPHPVILIGKYISFTEKKLRARSKNLRIGALWLTCSTVLLSMAACAAVLLALRMCGRVFLFAGMCIFSWQCISARCLAKEGRGVAMALRISLDRGRKQVGRIVGRDTSCLSESEIIRATVETIAENTTDGVIAPMLYLFIGGPVLAMGFKAASTLDSMVGYLDEKYRDIGWSSAKLDDILNYIPARLCALLMCLSARLLGMNGAGALRTVLRDHDKHLSPNCAWSEAAAAGALNVQLGGTHMYFGKPIEKPTIGDDIRPIAAGDIIKTNRLMYASSGMLALMILIAGVIL